ncbi:hypothetical protein AK830_g7890 [Neonectria ditissima]|uniref:Uncharacterized protein n=1 Tax=Neonectria ditissima TaxID=78410 RepID=A0A0P7ALP8_9HYPO|nr:hypothetical protein AK830_g7890 [Neonectria ditissima]
MDRSKEYERQHEVIVDGEAVYYFDVEVPGQVGPWKSVTFVGSQAATDDGFLCDVTTVSIGTDFDQGNQIADFKDVATASVKRCEVETFKAIHSSDIPTDQVLRFSVATILGIKPSWTITLPYSLAIELKNGSTIGYELRTLSFDRAHSGFSGYSDFCNQWHNETFFVADTSLYISVEHRLSRFFYFQGRVFCHSFCKRYLFSHAYSVLIPRPISLNITNLNYYFKHLQLNDSHLAFLTFFFYVA